MTKKTLDEQTMLNSLADFFGKHGMDGFEFVDEHGNVQASYKATPPPTPKAPLKGYGDLVSVGDTVVVGHFEYGKWNVEFEGKTVKVLNYGTRKDPFMLVENEGKKVSFNYVGAGWHRSFKVVKHG